MFVDCIRCSFLKNMYTMFLVIRLPPDGPLGPFYLLALAHSATLSLGIEVAF